MPHIVEYIREKAVTKLFGMDSFSNCWPVWQPHIRQAIGSPLTETGILNLGDELSRIFRTTAGRRKRSQSSLSAGGAAWEGLVCWYLNLCLAGTRSVVIKQSKTLIPSPLADAFTVKYGTVPSNTESDLVGITFPDKVEYNTDISSLVIPGIKTHRPKGAFNYREVIDYLCDRDFGLFEANIIQCKTNWNDNAQIPMLWDMIYASKGFSSTYISVGANNHQINALRRFAYSFVTVPSNAKDTFAQGRLAVQRVTSLSGGNYWGVRTEPMVAASIKDFFGRNFASATAGIGIRGAIRAAIPSIQTTYSYFQL